MPNEKDQCKKNLYFIFRWVKYECNFAKSGHGLCKN